jgi:exodeoxyribonuclease VII small subunit
MARVAKRGSADDPAEGAEPEGIDAILDGLEGVVKQLEEGDLPLERALERFEEGVRLARRGSQLLDAVEERVETLLADRDEIVPLRGGRDENEDA